MTLSKTLLCSGLGLLENLVNGVRAGEKALGAYLPFGEDSEVSGTLGHERDLHTSLTVRFWPEQSIPAQGDRGFCPKKKGC